MDSEKILARVIELFSAMTEAEEITADSDLFDDLEVSSMDVLFLISSLEEEFHIKVPEKELRKVATIGDLVEILEDLIG